MSSSGKQSKRVAEFRRWLTQEVPRFPNDGATLQVFKNLSITDQMIAYLNWRARHVSQHPRTVTTESTVSLDPRWQALAPNISILLAKVRAGDDLTPHLSFDIRHGFTLKPTAPAPSADSWRDKDRLLNVMGFHHFHLGLNVVNGHVDRTDDVLFAAVSRETFEALGIFDHDVFESDAPNAMPAERRRLWNLYEDRLASGAVLDGLLVGTGVSMSGHALPVVQAALRCAGRIRQMDSNLDQCDYLAELYAGLKMAVPAKPMLLWRFRHLDFGVFAPNEDQFWHLAKWPD